MHVHYAEARGELTSEGLTLLWQFKAKYAHVVLPTPQARNYCTFNLLHFLLIILFLLCFSLSSIRLQSLLDHFGYDVAYLKDWYMDVWYNQNRFNTWFATLRNNRRSRAIMPLLHEISSDDSDDNGEDEGEGRGPGGPPDVPPAGDEPGAQSPPSDDSHPEDDHAGDNPENGDANAPGPSTPPEEPHSSQSAISALTPEDIIRKIGGTKFYLNSHQVLIEDESGIIYGSYDQKFPFLSTDRHIPINPLVYVEGVHRKDFNKIPMDDPRVEDINTIIACSAQGVMEKGIMDRLQCLEEKYDDDLTPSIYKHVVSKVAGFTSFKGPSIVRKRPMMSSNPRVKYTKDGWIGDRYYDIKNKCGPLHPPVRPLKVPKEKATLPRLTRAQALAVASSLQTRVIYKKFPKKLLKFHNLI